MRAELEFANHEALLHYLDEINAGEPLPAWVLMQAQVANGGGQCRDDRVVLGGPRTGSAARA